MAKKRTAVSRKAGASGKPRSSRRRAYLTLSDVGAVAGVHPTTVSLALRDHPSIPESTRSRIKAVAAELGYQRDPLLDAFNFHRIQGAERTGTLSMAFLVDASASRFFAFANKTYHPLVFEGARSIALTHNYSFEIFSVGPNDIRPGRLNNILKARGISGVMLSTFDIETESLDLDWECFSAVKIESTHLAPHIDAVSNDQLQVTRLAIRRLHEYGYHRIGLVTAAEDQSRLSQSFQTGVYIEQASLPEAERVPSLIFNLTDVPRLPKILAEWIRDNHVDAVMSNWPELMPMMDEAGFRIPEDIAFCSLDVSSFPTETGGVVQNHRLVGMRAMEQLCMLAETYQRGVPETQTITYVPGFWRDGPTVPIRTPPWFP